VYVILLFLGHSLSDIVKAEKAFINGASFITHLFNAMLPFHHRDPGIVGVLTSMVIPKPAFYGMICDGIHTHPTSLRIAYRTHPKGEIVKIEIVKVDYTFVFFYKNKFYKNISLRFDLLLRIS